MWLHGKGTKDHLFLCSVVGFVKAKGAPEHAERYMRETADRCAHMCKSLSAMRGVLSVSDPPGTDNGRADAAVQPQHQQQQNQKQPTPAEEQPVVMPSGAVWERSTITPNIGPGVLPNFDGAEFGLVDDSEWLTFWDTDMQNWDD